MKSAHPEAGIRGCQQPHTGEIHHALKRAFTQLGAESCWLATSRRKFHLNSPITKCDYWPLNLVDHTQLATSTTTCLTRFTMLWPCHYAVRYWSRMTASTLTRQSTWVKSHGWRTSPACNGCRRSKQREPFIRRHIIGHAVFPVAHVFHKLAAIGFKHGPQGGVVE